MLSRGVIVTIIGNFSALAALATPTTLCFSSPVEYSRVRESRKLLGWNGATWVDRPNRALLNGGYRFLFFAKIRFQFSL